LTARLTELKSDPAELDRLLAIGADRARETATGTLAAAYQAVGLG
jgi:tryptophanyl-tRNA synthetase